MFARYRGRELGSHALRWQFSRSPLGELPALGAQRERLPEEHAQQQQASDAPASQVIRAVVQNDGGSACQAA